MKNNFVFALKAVSSALLLLMLVNCASQQNSETTPPQPEPESESTKQIVITGSRITREDSLIRHRRLQALSKVEKVATPYPKMDTEENVVITTLPRPHIPIYDPSSKHQIFKRYRVNPTIQTIDNAVSTFSMDADNGSYKLASAMLKNQQLPSSEGIRVEEFINAMDYQYQSDGKIFSISAEAMPSPFRQGYHILHLGLQTKKLTDSQRNPSNIIIVADVSGSMSGDKIQLLKNAMQTLVSQLAPKDNVALVVYNESAHTILEPTSVAHKNKIYDAIKKLSTGGSTNAESGLIRGYELAEKMYQPGFNNRVILTSDGMANVGSTSPEKILAKIKTQKEKGVFLTTVGVGLDMYNDHLLEQLANQGNGNYLYVATQKDIQLAFVDEITSQLQTVAKDAKIQVKFNPNEISSYRLLGYENRHLAEKDFTDATKDGGEIGAGHKVTALYEVKFTANKKFEKNSSLGTISIAYKKPQGHKVKFLEKRIPVSIIKSETTLASPDSRLSYAAAAFAEKLRQSYWSRFYDYSLIRQQLANLPTSYQQQEQVTKLYHLIQVAEKLDQRSDPYEHQYPINTMDFERVPLLD